MRIFGKSKPARPVDVVNQGIKAGVSVGRFRVSPQDAKRIRAAEVRGGQQAGLAVVLQILHERSGTR